MFNVFQSIIKQIIGILFCFILSITVFSLKYISSVLANRVCIVLSSKSLFNWGKESNMFFSLIFWLLFSSLLSTTIQNRTRIYRMEFISCAFCRTFYALYVPIFKENVFFLKFCGDNRCEWNSFNLLVQLRQF